MAYHKNIWLKGDVYLDFLHTYLIFHLGEQVNKLFLKPILGKNAFMVEIKPQLRWDIFFHNFTNKYQNGL